MNDQPNDDCPVADRTIREWWKTAPPDIQARFKRDFDSELSVSADPVTVLLWLERTFVRGGPLHVTSSLLKLIRQRLEEGDAYAKQADQFALVQLPAERKRVALLRREVNQLCDALTETLELWRHNMTDAWTAQLQQAVEESRRFLDTGDPPAEPEVKHHLQRELEVYRATMAALAEYADYYRKFPSDWGQELDQTIARANELMSKGISAQAAHPLESMSRTFQDEPGALLISPDSEVVKADAGGGVEHVTAPPPLFGRPWVNQDGGSVWQCDLGFMLLHAERDTYSGEQPWLYSCGDEEITDPEAWCAEQVVNWLGAVPAERFVGNLEGHLFQQLNQAMNGTLPVKAPPC